MSSHKSNILSAFNDHFSEFLTDVSNVFPTDADILTAKNSLTLVRKANPKIIIGIWNTHIVLKYKDAINKGDISFFIEKNYVEDLNQSANAGKIMEAIDRLRNPIKMMSFTDQQKTMKYIQNLTKLSEAYNSLE
jgi:hypothetical protein